MHYPTWFEQIEIEDDIVSEKSALCCWMKLEIMQLKGEIRHPVKKIEDILKTTDIIVNSATITYINEEDIKITIPEEKGLYILDNKEEIIQAAVAAEVISVTIEPKININDKTIELDYQDKQIRKVDCGFMYDLLKDKSIDPRDRRETVFQTLVNDPNLRFVYEYINSSVRTSAKVIERFKIKETVEDLEIYKTQMLQIDKKIETLSYGYLYGDMNRKLVRNIAAFLDIRQLLNMYRIKVVHIGGNRPATYLVRLLVRNGYYVIVPGVERPYLTIWDIMRDKYGLYSGLLEDIEYGFFLLNIEKKIDSNPLRSFYYRPNKQSNCRFYAMRMLINVFMEREQTPYIYGILPVALPHTCEVICYFPPLRTTPLKRMIQRASDAINFKNNYIYNRILWIKYDILTWECGYEKPFFLPVKGRYLVRDYKFDNLVDNRLSIKNDKLSIVLYDADLIIRNILYDLSFIDNHVIVFLTLMRGLGNYDIFKPWFFIGKSYDELFSRLIDKKSDLVSPLCQAKGVFDQMCKCVPL